MKVQALLNLLRPFAAILDAHGGGRLAARINALADVWAPAMSWKVKDLLSRAWPSDQLPEVDDDKGARVPGGACAPTGGPKGSREAGSNQGPRRNHQRPRTARQDGS